MLDAETVGALGYRLQQSLGNALLDPIKGFGVLSEYTRRRVTQATGIGAHAMSKHHPSLKVPAEIFDECTLNLSGMVDRLLRKHGKGIVGKQFATRRLGDIMIDLFTLGCVLSRVTASIQEKGEEKAALRALREAICARFIRRPDYRTVPVDIPRRAEAGRDYHGVVDDWHERIAARYRALFETALAEGETGALLVWGDPALYDGTIGILDDIRAAGLAIEVDVIAGISAVQALCARHGIPLNRVGETITITTARRVLAGEADGLTSFVVMLDSEAAWKRFADEDAEIFWGAYLGMGEEILVAGKIRKVGEEIERVRREARQRNGWVMDTYLVRRRMPMGF